MMKINVRHLLIFCSLVLCLLSLPACSAAPPANTGSMTGEKLGELIVELGEEVNISNNTIEFKYDGATLICIFDTNADRMRIISPIAEISHVTQEQLVIAMAANFHTVLDARYAIGDGIVYSVYVHPLASLTTAQVLSAVHQVATARNTFGSHYSSGHLNFPGGADKPPAKAPKIKT